MRLECSVTVINRLVPSSSTHALRKYKNAVVCLTENSIRKEVGFIVITKSNKGGCHYRVKGNVEQIFEQFIGHGKCTIRFKDPCHDISITSKAMVLKKFLSYVKRASVAGNPSLPGVSNRLPTYCKTFSVTSEKMIIRKKSDYPVQKGFPSTLKSLIIHECSFTRFDSRILRLVNLTTLSITKCKLKQIPVELGNLPLTQLSLSSNELANEKWQFLSGRIKNSLNFFDISESQVRNLPHNLVRVHSLRTLRASDNYIQAIPPRICQLPRLQCLDISGNAIRALPGTIRRIHLPKLDTLDISGNVAIHVLGGIEQYPYIIYGHNEDHDPLLGLVELSAECILRSNIPYNEEILPATLVKDLDAAGQCSCGKMVVKSYGSLRYTVDPKLVTNTLISSERQDVILVTYNSCSPKYNDNDDF